MTGTKKIPRIINHFLDTDLYKLSMCLMVITNDPEMEVEYEFVDRDNRVYPKGFDDELKEQIQMMRDIVITEPEIDFLRRKCYYFPEFFMTFLRGFRFDVNGFDISQDAEGHLKMKFRGSWFEKILWEVMLMAIISELYYIMTGLSEHFDYDEYYKMTYEKGIRLLEAGCVFSDFGTRRRASFKTQETAVRALYDAYRSRDWSETGGKFVGSSNPWFCMTIGSEIGGLTPVGTMAHEACCAYAGIMGSPLEANKILMDKWMDCYRGNLGCYLPDSFGRDIFSNNVTTKDLLMYRGLRVDSYDNYEMTDWIVDLYKSHDIDAKTKQVVYSNALDTDRTIELHKYASQYVLDSYGIGTHFTNDWAPIFQKKGLDIIIKALNMVIKLVAVRLNSKDFWKDTCKLSGDPGKAVGKKSCIVRFMEQLPEYAERVKTIFKE